MNFDEIILMKEYKVGKNYKGENGLKPGANVTVISISMGDYGYPITVQDTKHIPHLLRLEDLEKIGEAEVKP